MKKELIELPRWVKQFLAMGFDTACAVLATWLAYCLRLEELHGYVPQQKYAYLAAVALAIPIFYRFGVYKTVLRFTGAHSMALIAKAIAIYGTLYFTVIFMLASPYIYRSIGLVQPFLFLMLIVLGRIAASFALGFRANSANGRQVIGTLLIYGAGHSGMQLATALRQSGQYYLAGYIDDSPQYQGNSINGLMVYGPSEIARLIDTHGVTDILLAMPSINRKQRNDILQNLRNHQVHVRSLPDLVDLAQGRVTVLDIQELDPDDLLGRLPVEPNKDLVAKYIYQKTVLVTGAGGSIGSELCRQILKAKPKVLLLLDHSEYNLYAIETELRPQLNGDSQLISLLGSVRDVNRLKEIFSSWQVDTVYHAAAYKHVPLVEENPAEGLQNNVIGTFAEMVLQALANKQEISDGVKTCFSMVRFGNVLGSSGSVVPLFRDQIKVGGPVTLTHAEVTRYFMTIPEAAQLVIQAGAMANGGEVFVLDMGEPVKILDLAKRLIQLSGLTVRDEGNPHGDIEIIITGLRPGEKLFEELLIGQNPTTTDHPLIMMAKEDYLRWELLAKEIDLLRNSLNLNQTNQLIMQLKRVIIGYEPSLDH